MAVGEHRDGHAVEATNSGDLVRRYLAKPKCAMWGKSHRGPFSLEGLVDTLDGESRSAAQARNVALEACSSRP
jgi:hypothetical protein